MSWRNGGNNATNTRHWAWKYFRQSCRKPTVAWDTSYKYPSFSSRQNLATYTNSHRRFLISHMHIVTWKMEIFWCVRAVSEMKKEFSFLHHRTRFSYIPNIRMLMVHSRPVRKFSSNCIIHMVSVTEESFCVRSHFCQIKTRALTIEYLNSYFNL